MSKRRDSLLLAESEQRKLYQRALDEIEARFGSDFDTDRPDVVEAMNHYHAEIEASGFDREMMRAINALRTAFIRNDESAALAALEAAIQICPNDAAFEEVNEAWSQHLERLEAANADGKIPEEMFLAMDLHWYLEFLAEHDGASIKAEEQEDYSKYLLYCAVRIGTITQALETNFEFGSLVDQRLSQLDGITKNNPRSISTEEREAVRSLNESLVSKIPKRWSRYQEIARQRGVSRERVAYIIEGPRRSK